MKNSDREKAVAYLRQNGFVDCPRYEKRFLINQQGKVYSLFTHRFMHTYILPSGYEFLIVMLQKPRRHTKTEYIHRLVAEAFIPNPDGKETVNHKDGDKLNNDVKNLEWATQGENNLHAVRVLGWKRNTSGLDVTRALQKKLSPEDVRIIRGCESIEEAYEKIFKRGIICIKGCVRNCFLRITYRDVK